MNNLSHTHSWSRAIGVYLQPRVISMLFLGFSAGVPLLLIFSSLSIWLNEAGLEKSLITYFSWAALAYSFKFVWAPLIDRMPVPLLSRLLGRRRAWLLIAQLGIMLAIAWMALTNPAVDLQTMAFAAVLLGFSSATQDIVIDAYRIEAAECDEQAAMSAMYIAGYRIGMLVAGAGALKLAAYFGSTPEAYSYVAWQTTYMLMALVMLIGVATTLIIREPAVSARVESDWTRQDYLRFLLLFALVSAAFAVTFFYSADLVAASKQRLAEILGLGNGLVGFMVEAVRLAVSLLVAWLSARLLVSVRLVRAGIVEQTYIAPVADFIQRYGKAALLILALIGTYRISDIVLGVISNVFYQDIGFDKDQIANVTKIFGLIMTLLGGFLGGVLAMRFGVLKIMFIGALLSAMTNLLFVLLALQGNDMALLIVVISADNISAGIAGAAFVAYMSSLTNISFTALQYAIFSSLMTLLPKTLGGYSGTMIEAMGYPMFFTFTAILGIPVLLLIIAVDRAARTAAEASS